MLDICCIKPWELSLKSGRLLEAFVWENEKRHKTLCFCASAINFCGASNWELKKGPKSTIFRKPRILRIKIKTLFFELFSWSSGLNLHSSMESDEEYT